jgi:dihydroorotate dehydrogenase electron transfer subunit
MIKKRVKTLRGDFSAMVCSNEKAVGQRYYQLKLSFSGDGTKAFANAKPGQFAEIDLSAAAVPAQKDIPEDLKDCAERGIILRRPFSFSSIQKAKNNTFVNILYQLAGPATLRMMTLAKGDIISVVGPLGNGFWLPRGKRHVILLSGGMGIPPLKHIAATLAKENRDIEIIVLAGARSKKELPFSPKEFKMLGVKKLIITTDDGSAGIRGFVTVQLEKWLIQNPSKAAKTAVYCCGPEPMLAEAARIANKYSIDCQLSMERRMACGTGLCQGCAIECKIAGADETVYKMCCKDGPVFDSKEVVFNER